MANGDHDWRKQLGSQVSHVVSHVHSALDSVGGFVQKVHHTAQLHPSLQSVLQRRSSAVHTAVLSVDREPERVSQVTGTEAPRSLVASNNLLVNNSQACLDGLTSIGRIGELGGRTPGLVLTYSNLGDGVQASSSSSTEVSCSVDSEFPPLGDEKNRIRLVHVGSDVTRSIVGIRQEGGLKEGRQHTSCGPSCGYDKEEAVLSSDSSHPQSGSGQEENAFVDEENGTVVSPLDNSTERRNAVLKDKEARSLAQGEARPGRRNKSEPASWQVRWRGRSTRPWLVSSSSTDEELAGDNGWEKEQETKKTNVEVKGETGPGSFARRSVDGGQMSEFGADRARSRSPDDSYRLHSTSEGDLTTDIVPTMGSRPKEYGSGCLCDCSEPRQTGSSLKGSSLKIIRDREETHANRQGIKHESSEIFHALMELREKLTEMKDCLACQVKRCRDNLLLRLPLPFPRNSFDRQVLLQNRTVGDQNSNRGNMVLSHKEWHSPSRAQRNGLEDGLDESETPMVIAWEVSGSREDEKWPLEVVQLQDSQRADRPSRRLQKTQRYVDMLTSERQSGNGDNVNGQNGGDGSRRWHAKRAYLCRKSGGNGTLTTMPEFGIYSANETRPQKPKDSLTVNMRYDSQKRESETSVVFQDPRMRFEAGLGDVLSFVRGRGSRQAPHLEVQLADLIWQQDLIMFSLLSLPNQALWYGYNHKRDSHVLRTMVASPQHRWRTEGIFVVRPAPCRRLGLGLMHWSFRFPNGHFTWSAADGASGSVYKMALGGLLQANGSCAKDLSLSYERKVGQYGTKIRPLVSLPEGAVSMEILQPLAVDKSGIIFRPLCDARLVQTFNGRNKGMLVEVSAEPKERTRFGCGISTGRSLMAFTTASVGLSRRAQDSRGRYLEGTGIHLRIEAPPADIRRAAFTLELQTGIA